MKKTIILLIYCMLILSLGACEFDQGVKGDNNELKASEERANLTEHYNLSEDLYLTVINGVVNEDRSVKADGMIYIPYAVVKSLDTRFYYNKTEEQMIITTPSKLLYYYPNNTRHLEAGVSTEDQVPMLRIIDGRLYVSADLFLKYSDVSTRIMEDPSRVVLFANGVKYPSYETTKETALRIGASVQKAIVDDLKTGETVIKIGNAENGFMPVSTLDGHTGFVIEKDLGTKSETMVHASLKQYPGSSTLQHVHMMWHQMWAKQGGDELRAALANTKGINVIAPTWFDFKDTSGAITSFANASYVDEAHKRGIQVWALCSDFASDVKGYDVLSNTESRIALENNLVNEVVRVGADGINLDFEFITKDSGPHYIQFIRELYLLCHENGLVLSVDNFVPNAGKSQYQLSDQADVVDYVIFMAYDEHYKGSGAGSVASYPWVEASVNNALKIVPAEKIVLGIPLFTREWKTDSEGKLTLESGGMDTIRERAIKGGAKLVWDDELKQYYGEYTTKKNERYQYWIEDVTSLEYKVKLIPANHLAGYAGWKLGLESSDVWSLLEQY